MHLIIIDNKIQTKRMNEWISKKCVLFEFYLFSFYWDRSYSSTFKTVANEWSTIL
jgi:hypothetical protein